MTTESLFDALEVCLQALDQGADVESCLVRYPALADELRPILIAAQKASTAAVTVIPSDVVRRGKARVLQAAAEMREQRNVAPLLPFWRKKGFFGARFYRLAVTTALVIAFLLTGGTGLVNASSGALPGDRLYPVKRSWEGIQLVFVFDPQTKVELEHKFDHERVQEIEELYSEKRMEQVNFQGVVQSQQNGMWIIGGLNIIIEDETIYIGESLPGATVQVIGETDDGVIKAEQIILVATPGVTPSSIPTLRPAFTETVKPENTQENQDENETVDKSGEATDSPEVIASQESEDQKPGESETFKPENSGKSGSEMVKTPKPEKSGPGGGDGGGDGDGEGGGGGDDGDGGGGGADDGGDD